METAKKMKLALSLWVLFFTMAGATGTQANTHRHYFPLNVGNSWTYVNSEDGSTKTFTIIGAQEINGHTYYKFDDYVRVCGFPGWDSETCCVPEDTDMLFRYEPNTDKVLQYRSSTNEDLVRYDFSGNRWPDGHGNQLIETGVSCTVPAGQFDNCCIFEFAMTVDCGEFFETLAPGVGNVRFTEFCGHFELQSYTIVPEPAMIYYVDADANGVSDGSSWDDAFIYLQEALGEANSIGGLIEIRVAQGTYKPNEGVITIGDERALIFQLFNNVTVKGGYAGFGEPDPNARDIELYETILSGDLLGNDGENSDPYDLLDDPNRVDNSSNVLTGSSTDETAVLDGFTITGGHYYVNCLIPPCGGGGGMFNDNGSPILIDCTFTKNVGNDGGGICNYGDSGPTLISCTFTCNWALSGGGMYNDQSSPTLTNCKFGANSAVGGGAIYITGEFQGTLTDCLFENNTATLGGGAIYCTGTGELSIIRCEFRNGTANRGGVIYNGHASLILSECFLESNQAKYAGAISTGGDITLTNCLLANNQALVYGGALDIMGSTSRSVNCTFVGNSSNYGGAIFSNIECDTIAINCIFWNNTAQTGSQIATSGDHVGSTLTVNYCDIENYLDGLYVPSGCTLNWGEDNINADPLFADPCDGDFHLKSEGWRWSKYIVHGSHWWCDYVTSPCIDAGNPGSPLGNELLIIPDDPTHDWGENIRINMGAYGGTAQASMPPYGWALLGDLSNDGIVDYEDLAGQIEDWLTTASQQPGDLNRDGMVNMADFALLAQDWLAKTSWYEPPIVLEIYSSNYPKELLDIITMPQEGEITISIEREDYYYIYASRQGYSTELYYCEKGDTIDVDLDEIIHDKFNGVIFMSDVFFADQYLENTDVNVLDGNTPGSTIVAQFQTDSQGRFAIDPLAPGIYYFEFTFDSIHREEVEIQGQYQDFIFPYDAMVDKPNIYIYPEETMELDVNIVFPHGGHVTTSVPDYGTGWHITVEPSGVINGEFPCLFYEASVPDYGQYEAGWVVAQDQLEDFFRNNMALTGFNQKEIDDFIEYWIPRLTEYPYYAIYPQYNDELEEMIKLKFSTQPASLIRLIYSVRGLQTGNLSLQEPVVPPFSREGFTVAEWGVILK